MILQKSFFLDEQLILLKLNRNDCLGEMNLFWNDELCKGYNYLFFCEHEVNQFIIKRLLSSAAFYSELHKRKQLKRFVVRL
jgi:hypothetical protein